MNTSTYSLKARFQQLLTPIQNWLIQKNFTPNQITIFSCLICILYALALYFSPFKTVLLVLLPLLLFIRMALNALDGMVALNTKNQTPMGSILNEVCDVISDIALFAAFTLLLPISPALWFSLIFLSIMIEFIALAVYQASGTRPFSGPFGKSDRAVYLGLLAILLLIFSSHPSVIYVYTLFGIVLGLVTLWNRLKISL